MAGLAVVAVGSAVVVTAAVAVAVGSGPAAEGWGTPLVHACRAAGLGSEGRSCPLQVAAVAWGGRQQVWGRGRSWLPLWELEAADTGTPRRSPPVSGRILIRVYLAASCTTSPLGWVVFHRYPLLQASAGSADSVGSPMQSPRCC